MGQPGILAAMALDEIHVRLVYDPTLLTPEEAIRVFETATGLEVTR